VVETGGYGYATGLRGAGHFSREQAIRICKDALPTAHHVGLIAEIPVRLGDLHDIMRIAEMHLIPGGICSGRQYLVSPQHSPHYEEYSFRRGGAGSAEQKSLQRKKTAGGMFDQ
jgi:hypothetical protein